jgi:hypothetical protein
MQNIHRSKKPANGLPFRKAQGPQLAEGRLAMEKWAFGRERWRKHPLPHDHHDPGRTG